MSGAQITFNGEVFISEMSLVNALAQVYRENSAVVAKLCDDWLDPSGRLLGLVRNTPTARLPLTQEPEPK